MLPDALAEGIRAACGEALLLDARRGRALLADSSLLTDVCAKLKRAGYLRLIDFCGTHTAVREDGGDEFALFILLRGADTAQAALTLKWKFTLAAQNPAAHPTLSLLWPNAGLYEREMLEMLGLPFAGNEDLAPLLLDERMPGHPLRRDYRPPQWPSYAGELLRERHAAALLGSPMSGVRSPESQSQSQESGVRSPESVNANTGLAIHTSSHIGSGHESPESRWQDPADIDRLAPAPAPAPAPDAGPRTPDSGHPGGAP